MNQRVTQHCMACGLLATAWLLVQAPLLPAQQPDWQPQVEIEEEVYSFQPANNGAGPMWCSGSTCLVRGPYGLVASGLETLPQAKPLNNCRGLLFQRTDDGWRPLPLDDTQRTREPCPVAGFHDGRVFVSTNPTLTEPDAYNGPARPEIVALNLAKAEPSPEILQPRWQGTPAFSEHSYRSFAADGARGELILLQNIDYDRAEWTFRAADGQWSAAGQLTWPWGQEYEQPEPIRICYPNVMLKNRAVYFCGVSDIIEPNAKWRAYKKALTGRDWDYDFRRLFFTWSDDITTGQFHPWIEIASRDKTCGWIQPCDMWVAEDGRVHLLWSERALDERLRQEFFPAAKQSQALNYAVVKDGEIVSRRSLVLAEEGGGQETAGLARFQVTEDDRLFVFYYASGTNREGRGISENRVLEIHADGSSSPSVTVPLRQPFVSFFTATVRAGSPPSHVIDLLGHQAGRSNTISHARVRLW